MLVIASPLRPQGGISGNFTIVFSSKSCLAEIKRDVVCLLILAMLVDINFPTLVIADGIAIFLSSDFQ